MKPAKKYSAMQLIVFVISNVVTAYFLTTNLESVIPWFKGLGSQGILVYVESFVFTLGITFLLTNDDDRAAICQEMLPTLGFLGTAVGFTQFLDTFSAGGEAINVSGMKLAFLTTAQALFFNAILMTISFGKDHYLAEEKPPEEPDGEREGAEVVDFRKGHP